MLSSRGVGGEKSPYESWRGEVVSSSTEGRIETCEEIIQMGSDDSHALAQCSGPPAQDQSENEHRPG
jgi:hypothetical protein